MNKGSFVVRNSVAPKFGRAEDRKIRSSAGPKFGNTEHRATININ